MAGHHLLTSTVDCPYSRKELANVTAGWGNNRNKSVGTSNCCAWIRLRLD